MHCQAWRRTELMSCDGWADNKTFSFHCIFTFTLPTRVPSPFLKVMDCTYSGCDKVSLRCTCTLSFCSVSDVALRLRLEKVKNESALLWVSLLQRKPPSRLWHVLHVFFLLCHKERKSLSRLLI